MGDAILWNYLHYERSYTIWMDFNVGLSSGNYLEASYLFTGFINFNLDLNVSMYGPNKYSGINVVIYYLEFTFKIF